MNISLPAPLKSWVDQQVAERGFSTASEFVRDVLPREQTAEAIKAEMDAKLLAAIDSGPARKMTMADWRRIRTEGMKLAKSRAGAGKKR